MDKAKDTADKPVRIQFEFSNRLARELERFEDESELPTHREFFANALSLWRWAAQKAREGKTIAAIDVSGDEINYVELALPALDCIRENSLAEKALAAQTDSVSPQEV